jgi:hypothetical protein
MDFQREAFLQAKDNVLMILKREFTSHEDQILHVAPQNQVPIMRPSFGSLQKHNERETRSSKAECKVSSEATT